MVISTEDIALYDNLKFFSLTTVKFILVSDLLVQSLTSSFLI